MDRERMDALVDGVGGMVSAEEDRDIGVILAGFVPGAAHDVAGRPGGEVYGGEQIAGYYRRLLSELEIERFETVRRWHGEDHLVDESILHGTAVGRVMGIEGGGRRVAVRLLHVFDFGEDLITRESAWLDVAGLKQQLA
jgi:hypothetical protein